jgi:hypothetical protein
MKLAPNDPIASLGDVRERRAVERGMAMVNGPLTTVRMISPDRLVAKEDEGGAAPCSRRAGTRERSSITLAGPGARDRGHQLMEPGRRPDARA